MERVTRRPLPAADIRDILDHIAEDSVEQADRWVEKLDEEFKLIATQPLMGRARDELAADLRSFPFVATSSSMSRGKTGLTLCGCCTAQAISTQSSARTRRRRRPSAC
jgi:ParE toxin of type II toxin-antitoxin system, parDE